MLLLDEPTSALDDRNTALITQLVRDHLASGGTSVLVSHDLVLVRGLAHQIVVLDHGRLIAAGPPTEIDIHNISPQYPALGRFLESVQHPQQRGLASPAGAHHGGALPSRDRCVQRDQQLSTGPGDLKPFDGESDGTRVIGHGDSGAAAGMTRVSSAPPSG